MLETKGPLNCLSAEIGTRSKRNFHRPQSNCGMALNSGCRVFIVLQPQPRLQIQAPRQSTGSVPQTRKKCSNLSFQESDFSSCHFSQAFEDRHFTQREISFETLNELRRTWIVASGLGSSKGYSHPAKKYIRLVFMFGHLSGN